METQLHEAFTHPLPLFPRTPRAFSPEPPQWAYLGQDMLSPPCGEQDYCALSLMRKRNVANSLQALESLGHLSPTQGRAGPGGVCGGAIWEVVDKLVPAPVKSPHPADSSSRTPSQVMGLRGLCERWKGPPGEEPMGLCFALIEHLMKFYLYIYINIKYIYVSVWAGTLEVFSSSCNSNHCCYLITGLPQ